MMVRGLVHRCPVCGSSGIIRRWFSMQRRCPRCDLHFERQPGSFVGGVGLNTIVAFGALLITLVIAFIVTDADRTAAQVLIPTLIVGLAAPLAFFGSSKLVWVAIELLMLPLRPGEATAHLEPLAVEPSETAG